MRGRKMLKNWFAKSHKVNQRKPLRQKPPIQWNKRLRWMTLTIAMVATLIVAQRLWSYLHDPSVLPIKAYVINGEHSHINQQAIDAIVQPYLNQTFFNIDTQQLQQQLLDQLPWLAKVDIRKIWPYALLIKVTEQQPVARWGVNSLLTAQGIVFTPSDPQTIPSNLPIFYGQANSVQDLLQTYQKIEQILTPLQLNVVIISLDIRRSWQVTLSNGIVLMLGQLDIIPRLQQLVRVYPNHLADRAAQIASIDLRYSNGFAVSWKKV